MLLLRVCFREKTSMRCQKSGRAKVMDGRISQGRSIRDDHTLSCESSLFFNNQTM